MTSTGSSATPVMELEKRHLLQNYARYPILLERGEGCYVFDSDGRRYLDLLSGIGVNALGHNHPLFVEAISEQAGLLLHTSNLYYHRYQGPLAQRLCQASGLDRVFFCNSGAEAIEAAIKAIHSHGRRIAPSKFEILSLLDSFHGRTMGALSLTGQEKYRRDFEPLVPGVHFIPRNDFDALEAAVGPNTAGIVLEGIQGEGGIHPICGKFVHRARELASKHDALLVFDEIQCGVGRTGTYFQFQMIAPAVLPDILVTAKPISCGLPLGTVMLNERAAAAIDPGMHGTTFGGGPLACRVALDFMDHLDGLLPHIRDVGGYFLNRLHDLSFRMPIIQEVRGAGLMLGVELNRPCKPIVTMAMDEGVLLNVTHDSVIRMLPPFILSHSQVDDAMAVLERVITRFAQTQ
jgi:predicted acetylornithine/succinylornithine family transaminase